MVIKGTLCFPKPRKSYHSNFHLGQSLTLNKFGVFFLFFFEKQTNLELFLKPTM